MDTKPDDVWVRWPVSAAGIEVRCSWKKKSSCIGISKVFQVRIMDKYEPTKLSGLSAPVGSITKVKVASFRLKPCMAELRLEVNLRGTKMELMQSSVPKICHNDIERKIVNSKNVYSDTLCRVECFYEVSALQYGRRLPRSRKTSCEISVGYETARKRSKAVTPCS